MASLTSGESPSSRAASCSFDSMLLVTVNGWRALALRMIVSSSEALPRCCLAARGPVPAPAGAIGGRPGVVGCPEVPKTIAPRGVAGTGRGGVIGMVGVCGVGGMAGVTGERPRVTGCNCKTAAAAGNGASPPPKTRVTIAIPGLPHMPQKE